MTDVGGVKIVTEGGRAKDGKTNKKNNMPLNFWDIIFMLRANQLTKSDTVGSMDITIRYTCFDALRPSQHFSAMSR